MLCKLDSTEFVRTNPNPAFLLNEIKYIRLSFGRPIVQSEFIKLMNWLLAVLFYVCFPHWLCSVLIKSTHVLLWEIPKAVVCCQHSEVLTAMMYWACNHSQQPCAEKMKLHVQHTSAMIANTHFITVEEWVLLIFKYCPSQIFKYSLYQRWIND